MKHLMELPIWLMFVALGWVFAVLMQPMVTGQEELTRWTTHAITNGTAMFFMVSLGFLVLMLFLAGRAKDQRARRALILLGYAGCFALMGVMSFATPFGL